MQCYICGCPGVWSDCGLRGVMQQLMLAPATDGGAVMQTAQQFGYSGEPVEIRSLHQLTAVMPGIVDKVVSHITQHTVSDLYFCV